MRHLAFGTRVRQNKYHGVPMICRPPAVIAMLVLEDKVTAKLL
jgi:hypothetical protein